MKKVHRYWGRASNGLTLYMDRKARAAAARLNELLSQGLTHRQAMKELKVSARVKKALGHYCRSPASTQAANFARIVELLVEGFAAGRSLKETCELHEISTSTAYDAYHLYAENNQSARLLTRGHSHYSRTRDEYVVPMLQLFVELTGFSYAYAARSLKVTPDRVEWLRSLYELEHRGT